MLDTRSISEYDRERIVCAVSTPMEDGEQKPKLLQRVLDHDEEWGWCLQHPFVLVYDGASKRHAQWIAEVLAEIVHSQGDSDDAGEPPERRQRPRLDGDRGARLLWRLASQCRQVWMLRHADFSGLFPPCCVRALPHDAPFPAASFFDDLGPLPRCALACPRIFLGGRQVQLSTALLRRLCITHVVVNADSLDVIDGTSGGAGGGMSILNERVVDVAGIRYLKCAVPDRDEDADIPCVLEGAAQFLMDCAAQGGAALIKVHGMSRTASIVCAFLITSGGLSPERALEVVEAAGVRGLDHRLIWWSALHAVRPAVVQQIRSVEDGDAAEPSH